MICLPRFAAAVFSTVVVLTAVTAEAQLATERHAIADVTKATTALKNGGPETTVQVQAAQKILAAGAKALKVVRHRAIAESEYHAKVSVRKTLAVNCENDLCDANGNVDLSLGLEKLKTRYARSYKAASTVSDAMVKYAEAVGISGADTNKARARAEKLRRLVQRIRDLSTYNTRTMNALIREANADHNALDALRHRAADAHKTANRTALDAFRRAGETLSTVVQLPEASAVRVAEATAAIDDPELPNDSNRTAQALQKLMSATSDTMSVLKRATWSGQD